MTSSDEPVLGRCGPYRLDAHLGIGGMGEIFRGVDERSGAPVAVKRLLPECASDEVFVGMFLDEARLVRGLDHPNIVRVHEHGKEGSHYFLVMDLIDGLSLKELLYARDGRGLPWPLAARMVAEVSSALDYAHRLADADDVPLGIVHRDVSPANIMLASDGSVKLVDFGLAKARTQLVKTQPGMVKGKYGYLAPEQLTGDVDWRTDQFALGLCLYEALTAEPLFGQAAAAAVIRAISQYEGPPALPPELGLPAALDDILEKSLAREPNDRFESVAAFRAALGEVVVANGKAGEVSAQALAAEVRESMAKPRVTMELDL